VTTIGLVLGKPPGRSPVLGDVVVELQRRGHEVQVHTEVHTDRDRPPAWLDEADVVAVRGASTAVLRSMLPAEARGVRFCDPPSQVLAVRDRRAVAARLAAAGIDVPRHATATSWDEVRAITDRRADPAVVKHVDGAIGRGARVLHVRPGELLAEPPFPGPYLVEDLVRGISDEVKLYLVGDHVAAFLADPVVTRPVAARPGPRDLPDLPDLPGLTELGTRVGDALGLTLLGADVLLSRGGPQVVDVNAFPSCRRLPDAATRIADHLGQLADGTSLPVQSGHEVRT
jgi:ribosomal protein S6--L-glutamate ligase